MSISVHIQAGTPAELEAWAIAYLRDRGYIVSQSGPDWETPAQLCRRIGISSQTFSRRIQSPDLPPAELVHGPTGRRIVRLASNPVFDSYLKHGVCAKSE